jgi:hypothetical protein
MLALAVLACALALLGCASQKAPTDEEAYQRFVGSWVNEAYPGTPDNAQVTEIKPDHVGEDWPTPASSNPSGQWKLIVKKTWVQKGSTYCQYIAPSNKNPGWLNAWLMRVDKAGKVIEFQWGSAETSESALRFPEAIDPQGQMYFIYYRKE